MWCRACAGVACGQYNGEYECTECALGRSGSICQWEDGFKDRCHYVVDGILTTLPQFLKKAKRRLEVGATVGISGPGYVVE
jgi:hypothetical protein